MRNERPCIATDVALYETTGFHDNGFELYALLYRFAGVFIPHSAFRIPHSGKGDLCRFLVGLFGWCA